MVESTVFDANPTETLRLTRLYPKHLKRLKDVAFVLAVAPFVVPIVLLLALLVRQDGGTAFFSQDRIGRDGRIFRIFKLRTMVMDAESQLAAYLEANPVAKTEWDCSQKLKDDPRITGIGLFLRKTSLDELPQLWNVFRGEMSLVGPRPMLPSQVEIYPGQAYYQLRPGLTGFWQISRRNNSSFAARARFDNRYSKDVSLRTDLLVMLATVRVVCAGTGY